MTLTPADKPQLRESALARRDALPPDARRDAAQALAERGLPMEIAAGAVVSGFMPIRTELNPLPLLNCLAAGGASLALPAIQGRGRPLALRAWAPGGPLVAGQWGIREPGADTPEVAPDIVLTPLAAFDRRGHRVGYGAGYYDMTIADLRRRKTIIAIGIAFSVQQIDRVPDESHDQQLDFIMTEAETIVCRAGSL